MNLKIYVDSYFRFAGSHIKEYFLLKGRCEPGLDNTYMYHNFIFNNALSKYEAHYRDAIKRALIEGLQTQSIAVYKRRLRRELLNSRSLHDLFGKEFDED